MRSHLYELYLLFHVQTELVRKTIKKSAIK